MTATVRDDTSAPDPAESHMTPIPGVREVRRCLVVGANVNTPISAPQELRSPGRAILGQVLPCP